MLYKRVMTVSRSAGYDDYEVITAKAVQRHSIASNTDTTSSNVTMVLDLDDVLDRRRGVGTLQSASFAPAVDNDGAEIHATGAVMLTSQETSILDNEGANVGDLDALSSSAGAYGLADWDDSFDAVAPPVPISAEPNTGTDSGVATFGPEQFPDPEFHARDEIYLESTMYVDNDVASRSNVDVETPMQLIFGITED